jgi:DNA-directed RNA polymerase specialized sigma24 family protein
MAWPTNSTQQVWWKNGTTMEAAAALSEVQQYERMMERLSDSQAAEVARARKAGASWSQIGAALGISKQAAQKRYDRRLF